LENNCNKREKMDEKNKINLINGKRGTIFPTTGDIVHLLKLRGAYIN